MNLYYNFILHDNKMADFERRQFEIGLKFMRCSFAERNNFSEGSSELKKDAQVIRVRGAAAPQVFKLELLVAMKMFQCTLFELGEDAILSSKQLILFVLSFQNTKELLGFFFQNQSF